MKFRWALPFVLAGCGSSDGLPRLTAYPVKGKVLLADGKPLTSGRVYFVRQEEPVIRIGGDVGADGQFELTTAAPGDGAPEGRYKVMIDPSPMNSGATPAGPAKARPSKLPRIPAKFLDEDTSGLAVTVQAGPNDLEPFRLK